jgi:hypothetical protein
MATYIQIGSNILTTATSSVTFSSIPQTYTDLVVKASVRTANASNNGNFPLTFNGDTSASYSFRALYGSGSTAASEAASGLSNVNEAEVAVGDAATANCYSSYETYIPNYAGNAYKSFDGIGMQERNSATNVYMYCVANLWSKTAAITSITYTANGTDFMAGTSFYLYGIKKD